jgi:hypothetical protein
VYSFKLKSENYYIAEMSEPVINIKSISRIVHDDSLRVPSYQRPYTWQTKHVIQLLNDIRYAMKNQGTYRIGTLIFEQSNLLLNIVDGQQRLTTIVILLYELGEKTPALSNAEYAHEESQANIKANQSTIANWITEIGDEKNCFKNYLLSQCEAVTIELSDLGEAFQFFDSQNARGKELDPTDLLKAYHLREMDRQEADEKQACADVWDDIGPESLKSLIGSYLYRIRLWSRGRSASPFSKEDIEEFKGFNLADSPPYPYLVPYRLNEIAQLSSDRQNEVYPYQINQLIINGKRFFDMIGYYQNLYTSLFNGSISPDFHTFHDHSKYDEDHRTGDRYTKMLYKAAVLAYYDRFGNESFTESYPLLFMWAYKPRIENKSVRYQTSNNTVQKTDNNIFRMMQESLQPDTLKVIKPKLELKEIKQNLKTVRAVFQSHHLDHLNGNAE